MTPRRFLALLFAAGLVYAAVAYGHMVAVVAVGAALVVVTVAYVHEEHRSRRSVTCRARMVDELAAKRGRVS